MEKILGILKYLVLNKKHGKKFLGLNILYTIVPIITSIVQNNNAWTVSLTIFLIYMSSYILASISASQYKALGQQSEPDVIIKAFSFVFSMLAMVIYSIISLHVSIPIESLYIYSYGIISLLALFWMILKENTRDIIGFGNKFKTFMNDYKEIVCGDKNKSIKGILRGSILSFFIILLITLVVLITSYRIVYSADKLSVFIYRFVWLN